MRKGMIALMAGAGLMGAGLLAAPARCASSTGAFNLAIKGYELIGGVTADIKGVGHLSADPDGTLVGGILSYSSVNPIVGATPQSATCTGAVSGSILQAGTFGLYTITLDFNDVPPPTPPSTPLCTAQTLTLTCTRADAPTSSDDLAGGAYICSVVEDVGTGITAASLSVDLNATSGISSAL